MENSSMTSRALADPLSHAFCEKKRWQMPLAVTVTLILMMESAYNTNVWTRPLAKRY